MISPRPASAAWPHDPGVNLPIVTAANYQAMQSIVADGSGGAIIAWSDYRSGTDYDVYAQHVLPSGIIDPAWPVNGRALCTAGFDQANPMIISDGAGGAIVAWQDARPISNFDIYAQHVLASGVVDPAWPVNGRALCTAANSQTNPTLTSDGAGGAIVTWWDGRGANNDIYAQHVLSNGAVDGAWPVDGRVLCAAANDQSYPTIVSDGAGGAVVTWMDQRAVARDIYAQHIRATGTVDPAWPADGRAICTAANEQWLPQVVSDGAGGAIITWYDYRNGANADIYAQHVLISGTVDVSWPADGRALCTQPNNQQYPQLVSDGSGGAIVTWHDLRSGPQHIFAQHVLPDGIVDPAWPADGRALSTAAGNQFYPTIVSDGAGGAVVAWEDGRTPDYNIYAQHVSSGGVVDPSWPTDGRALCIAAGDQTIPVTASDGAGGAIVAWQDPRAGNSLQDIYAQRVARFGYLGTPEAEIINVKDVPGDNGGKVKVSWYASWLDLASDPNLSTYYVYRSAAPNAAYAAVKNGAALLSSLGAAPAQSERAFYIGRDQAQVYAWEFLGSVTPAHYLSAYSYIASTLGDSTGAYNPRTAFMVVAQKYDGSMYWLSRPDSGYSVDNLPPYPPAPFAGTYSAGTASLHWSPNSDADLANYRLYRGTSSSFVPSPANRIATPTDTLYGDPAGNTYWYKLSAVDIHGNESAFTALLPAGALDAPADALPRVATLERPAPNPSGAAVMLRYSLPRETRLSLAIYDANGRRVRDLVSGMQPAGDHALRWDLRDATGKLAPAGLYFVRLEGEGRSIIQRLVTVR
ncbi:MAG TPA: FlgD immunoglobulin-like domain containing protein [Candidatus Udaeobacter sp.]|nr:FlgD immunoglobulin-like domain containing protein [Candidatus Udaeobacter sp.]